jgi:hypothetical protein
MVAPGFGVLDRIDVVLQHDLLRRVLEPHRRQPAPVSQGPGASPARDPLVAQQKPLQVLLTGSRIASCAASGIHIGVSSPARCSLASISASRRSVLTRSPALIGISEGATTPQ